MSKGIGLGTVLVLSAVLLALLLAILAFVQPDRARVPADLGPKVSTLTANATTNSQTTSAVANMTAPGQTPSPFVAKLGFEDWKKLFPGQAPPSNEDLQAALQAEAFQIGRVVALGCIAHKQVPTDPWCVADHSDYPTARRIFLQIK